MLNISKIIGKGLASCPNRTWLVKTLQALQVAGALNTKGSLRNQVQKASLDHARAITPYGRVVQTLDLGDEKCVRGWEYVNPFAWLYYISFDPIRKIL